MNIVSLNAENILRLEAISIQADGKNVVLSGKNGSGKTSVIRCIEIALGGKGMMAEKTIREGEKEGSIEIDLGDIKAVCRVYIAKSGQEERTIKLVSKEGASFPSPQAMLDKLVGQLTFDPLAFSRLDAVKQSDTLRDLVGLDFGPINKERKEVFEKRTIVNREVDRQKALLQSQAEFPDAPQEELTATDILAEITRAQAHNAGLVTLEARAAEADRAFSVIESVRDQVLKDSELYKAKLASAEAELKQTELDLAARDKEANDAQAAVDTFRVIETAPLTSKLSQIEEINKKVRQNKSVAVIEQTLNAKIKEAAGLTDRIDALDVEKEELLQCTKFPVTSLSFSETGVLYKGLPFEQASAGEQLRVSAAIGMALNPKLKILMIRDASLLDDETMKTLAAQAHEKGYQLWLERVGAGKEVSVLIEEGGAK